MKKLTTVLTIVFLSSNALANDWHNVNKSNKSKINSYLVNKNCVAATKAIKRNGWSPFTYLDKQKFNRDSGLFGSNDSLFVKYPELEMCYSTGEGACYAGYRKGKYQLTVKYSSAEGGAEFESKFCNPDSYKIEVIK